MENLDLIKKAVKTWENEHQVIMAIEELAELQKELTKYLCKRGDKVHIAEEMADVEIMLAQLKIIFNDEKEMEAAKARKMEKLRRLLEDHDTKNKK